ncbi:MAG: AbrB/MazE/SpoVT family DNA-binding domain-containing protein [Candidatus Blackburnbacteria bacterium]|nr:AbrB/MazE/SpoVT family DNA-binding domain-containing protein [Candidatus Blackburnbacteria bacterium]
MTSQGQISIPAKLRRKLGLHKKTKQNSKKIMVAF